MLRYSQFSQKGQHIITYHSYHDNKSSNMIDTPNFSQSHNNSHTEHQKMNKNNANSVAPPDKYSSLLGGSC